MLAFDQGIDPLDLHFEFSQNDLVITLMDSGEMVTIDNWADGTNTQVETIEAGDGSVLLNTQVESLVQAMASFVTDNGLTTWDEAVNQYQADTLTLVSTYWQPTV